MLRKFLRKFKFLNKLQRIRLCITFQICIKCCQNTKKKHLEKNEDAKNIVFLFLNH